MTHYDYIVVGAGSAGCVLANRLSASGRHTVALIEAGREDNSPLIRTPLGIGILVPGKRYNWHFHTEAQAQLKQRRLFWPRGKVLGGSSSINAMMYTRGHATDYDDWAQLGNDGWSYAEVLPYFRKAEHQQLGANEFHGADGPLHVTNPGYINPMSPDAYQAGLQAGYRANDDFNGAEQEGWGYYQMNTVNGERCSTARAYIEPVRQRQNLHVIVKAHATRLLLDQKRARGVEILQSGQLRALQANKEVIVSSGAIGSPQLLMLSGLGKGSELHAAGIQPVHELPGVGQHLLDHLDIMVQHRCASKVTHGIGPRMVPRMIKALWDYSRRREGLLTSCVVEVGGFLKTDLALPRPDLQLQFMPTFMREHGAKLVPGHGYTLHVCQLRPWSEGHIKLASPHATDAPRIDPRYLSDERDLQCLIEGLRICRKVFAAPAIDRHRGPEVLPGAGVQSDEQIADYIRQYAETIYHPVGTCKMGHDDMAVVNKDLRVHGIEGLRVIDASIMPTLVGGNTNAPTVMIAEKGADLILQDAGRDIVARAL